MMTELNEWAIEGRDVFIDRWGDNGLETMTREEAEARINEYETLKKATERLSADFQVRVEIIDPKYPPTIERELFQEWLDILEGK